MPLDRRTALVTGAAFAALAFANGPALATAPAAKPDGFQAFLAKMRREALAAGIGAATVRAALTDVQPLHRVVSLDRAQPEKKASFASYRAGVVSATRIAGGQQKLAENRGALLQAQGSYNVPMRFILALWGIETSYGRNTGGHSVIAALATLAYDGRRADFFKKELFNALKIVDAGHIAAARMIGSWAGAMGQCQFMPSSFLHYAVDMDGDGRRDLWNSTPDVVGSIANYLHKVGWKPGQTWGRAVQLPAGFDRKAIGLETERSLDRWAKAGVRRADGRALPQDPGMTGSLVQPDGAGTPAFLVYDNFKVFRRWNKSTSFALSAGLLADAIGNG